MASIARAFLLCLVLVQLHPLAASSVHADGNLTHHSTPSLLCRPDQANALLKLKQSFMLGPHSTALTTWQAGTDCCLWEGVGCSNSSGHVTALDLSGFGLQSSGIDPVLFNLTSLRLLDLSMNDFGGQYGYEIPSVGFEKLALLTHLNLSDSGIGGQVPAGISKLRNLVSLDLSNRYTFSGIGNMLWTPKFQTLVANLSNLSELYLDGVSMLPSTAEDCFKALAKSSPHLRVLSLEFCFLQGRIDGGSLSRLHSLAVINLNANAISPGLFPEFFMNFRNLKVLQLSGINLQGWFPRGMFRSKNLRVLDLSENPNLSGNMATFSDVTSLETLMIDGTNFSYVKSSYFSNFKALTELSIDGKIISRNFLSSSGMLASLRTLSLTGLDSPKEMESVFSLFEGIKNLSSLRLNDCDLSMIIPSSTGNLKSLTSFGISNSRLATQTLSAVATINRLKFFTIDGCSYLLGQQLPSLPSTIGNMTNLETLDISGCQISGPIPHEVGALKKLTSLVLSGTGLSGRIPSSIANLTQLTELQLPSNYLSGKLN